MIVPQLAFGGWTPIERNESADSASMLSATMRGKNTTTLGAMFGITSLRRMRRSDAPTPSRGEDELAFAQRDHLAADRPATYGMKTNAMIRIGNSRLSPLIRTMPRSMPFVSSTTESEIASR